MGTISKLPGAKSVPAETPEDRFVAQFLIDRDPVAAAIRAGVKKINVESRVKAWMNDPAIRKRIQEETDNCDLDTMISPQRIMAGFMEVAFDQTAPSAARNSALRELAQLKKMYPEKEDPNKGRKYAKSVMFVPAAPALTDWEQAAMQQQQALREDVRK